MAGGNGPEDQNARIIIDYKSLQIDERRANDVDVYDRLQIRGSNR